MRSPRSQTFSSSFAFALPFALVADAAAAKAAKAPKEPDPIMVPITDQPGLPRVLLIGDSISMGYTLPVRQKLAGKANLHRALENSGDTQRGLQKLDAWLGQGRWDVIHFNFGLHDLKYLDAGGKYVPPDKGKQVTPLHAFVRSRPQIQRPKNVHFTPEGYDQMGDYVVAKIAAQLPAR